MTTATAEADLQTKEWRPSRWIYVLAPFVAIPGAVIAIWQLPTIAFGALTLRWAVDIENDLLLYLYAAVFGLFCVASFAWPFAVLYAISQL